MAIAIAISRLSAAAVANVNKVCTFLLYTSLILLLLDGLLALYARTLNPDGYGLLYPLAFALILLPVAVTAAVILIVLKIIAKRRRALTLRSIDAHTY